MFKSIFKFIRSTGLAAAAFGVLFLNGTLVPEKFCDGLRFDGTSYSAFIDKHALTEQEAAQLNDPVTREQARRAAADRWGRQIRSGQLAKCGQASF